MTSAKAEAPLVTVLLPVNRPPDLLPFAVRSVQAQTAQAFELFIVCDGPPRATVDAAHALAIGDARIRVFDCPKGERNGEVHRHAALQEARGAFVAQIGDDDFWFPEHLATIAAILTDADFANVQTTFVDRDGRIDVKVGDMSLPWMRARMLADDPHYGFFGPTFAGYRLSAYRGLPEGWSPAPAYLPSDLFMWRKFLRQDLRFNSSSCTTALKFHAARREDMTMNDRRVENALWSRRLTDPAWRERIRADAAAMIPRRWRKLQSAFDAWRIEHGFAPEEAET